MGEWQPIESAPSGPDVLVWASHVIIATKDSHGEWTRENEGADLGYSTVRPTHWMPLPEPPND